MGKRHRWTDEEIAWLRAHIKEYGWRNIHIHFNQHFNLNLTQASVEHACLRRKITHGRENEQGFVAGQHNAFSKTHPIGSERADSRGRVFIKVSDDPAKVKWGNWIQKDRYIWEKAHGKLDKNDLLLHLDGDKSNCELSNLYVVSRRINCMLMSFGWFFTNPILTLTAIRCCELMEHVENRVYNRTQNTKERQYVDVKN